MKTGIRKDAGFFVPQISATCGKFAGKFILV